MPVVLELGCDWGAQGVRAVGEGSNKSRHFNMVVYVFPGKATPSEIAEMYLLTSINGGLSKRLKKERLARLKYYQKQLRRLNSYTRTMLSPPKKVRISYIDLCDKQKILTTLKRLSLNGHRMSLGMEFKKH